MIARTFWVWHEGQEFPDPEAIVTQVLVDENPEGWEHVKQEVRDRYGGGIHSEREIEIRLDDNAVLNIWWPDPIDGALDA